MTEAAGVMPKRSRHISWIVLALIISILGCVILLTTLHFRRGMRQLIIQQDGIGLYAATFVKDSLLDSLLEGLGPEVTSDPELQFADMAVQMFDTASKRGAIAVRVFDAEGQLQMALPFTTAPRRLDTN